MAGLFATGPEVAGNASAEIDFLIASSAPSPLPTSATAPVKPQRLYHLARYNKMLGWLPLSPQALPPGSQALAADLLQVHLRTARMNQAAMAVSLEVGAALAAKGLRHVVLKGPFQQMAIHGQAFKRPSGDVDLLVRRQDRVRAAQVLIDLGFEALEADRAMWWISFLGEQHFRREADGAVVDLHHSLQQVGLPGWRHPEEVLDRSAPLPFQTGVVQLPGTEDACLLLAVTMAKALLAREPCGGAVADLAWWLGQLTALQWRDLHAVARRSGQGQTLRLALVLVAACYGPPRVTDPDAADAMALAMQEARARLHRLDRDPARLRNLVFQPWHDPAGALRRRSLLRMLAKGRPQVLVGQGVRAALSPLVLGWISRGGGNAQP